jgi:hypothetical protein
VRDAQSVSSERLARALEAEGVIAPEWTAATAVDLLYGLIATDLIDRLTTDRHWSPDELASRLSTLLLRTLTTRRA